MKRRRRCATGWPIPIADGDTKTVELIDQIDWCKNRFQVTQQVTVEGRFKNRYDVTILINGLPLVQIELKRRGLELIHRDEINVTYILKLLAELKEAPIHEQADRKKTILDLLSGDAELRSKRELIEQFIEKNLPHIDDPADIPEEFEAYWLEEQALAFKKLAEEEGLDSDKLEKLIGDYLFTSKKPLRDDVVNAMNEKPRLSARISTAERIIDKIFNFIDTFINGTLGG